MSARPIFQNVKQESTRDKVYAAVKDAILAGRLKTGERITEILLAGEFNVSRAVIREALQQLAHDGLVEQNSYKGTRVVQLTPEQVDEIISARVLLEGEVIRHVKDRLTEADKKMLKGMARKLEHAVSTPETYAEEDLLLHEKLWQLSGNQTLTKLLKQITTPLFAMGTIYRYSSLFPDSRTHPRSRSNDHIELINVICDGAKEEAVKAIQEHITRKWKQTREHIEELVETSGSKKLKSAGSKKRFGR